jgi:hypothetical protein
VSWYDAAKERLAGLERLIERTTATRKFAPSDLDRRRIDRKLGLYERQATELRELLGGGAVPWGSDHFPSYRCPDCGARLQDRRARWPDPTCRCAVFSTDNRKDDQ